MQTIELLDAFVLPVSPRALPVAPDGRPRLPAERVLIVLPSRFETDDAGIQRVRREAEAHRRTAEIVIAPAL